MDRPHVGHILSTIWPDEDQPLTLSLPRVPNGTYRILLCLMPDNFTRQWGTPWGEWVNTLEIAGSPYVK